MHKQLSMAATSFHSIELDKNLYLQCGVYSIQLASREQAEVEEKYHSGIKQEMENVW